MTETPNAEEKAGGVNAGKLKGLLPVKIGRENHGQLEFNAADLLVGGAGLNASAKGDNAERGLSALYLGGSDSDVELHKLEGHGTRIRAFALAEMEVFGAANSSDSWRAQAGNFFGSVFRALMNLSEGLGNKFSEVHG